MSKRYWLATTKAALFLASAGLFATASARTPSVLTMTNADGPVRIDYDLKAGTADFYWHGAKRVAKAYAEVKFPKAVKSTDHEQRTSTVRKISDRLGNGTQFEITCTSPGLPVMKQEFYLYDHKGFFLTEVSVGGSELSSRWMAPVIVTNTGGVDIGTAADPRALVVPWDNDGFVRYAAGTINRTNTSYEVGAFYDNDSRKGLVVGSVTHDTWKSGIDFQGAAGKLDRLQLYGGASAKLTRDVMPHGAITGNTLRSPRMFVGYFYDWRHGLEEFADANVAVAPPLPWPSGLPFGWNSWGTIRFRLNYDKAVAVSDFIKNHLQNHGFSDEGVVYVNLDSGWDRLSDAQLTDFVQHCKANGQKAGIYFTPFALLGRNPPDTTAAAVLKDADGQMLRYDNAYSLDPTHPYTQQRIKQFFDRMISKGFEYVKLDFTDNGAMESQSHYDPAVTTGIQAYNAGMKYLVDCVRGRMFISLSIAPLFPYQYGHSRRVSCDTFGKIKETEYMLNSASYGWWMSGRIYAYNDPDHMVLSAASENEARSRVTSAAIAGTVFLNGDDLSADGLGRQRAVEFLTNKEINAVAKIGKPFRPIEANSGTGAADEFVLLDGAACYLAVFNYGATNATKTIDLTRAGLSGTMTYKAADLWSGTVSTAKGSIPVPLQEMQATLLRLTSESDFANPE